MSTCTDRTKFGPSCTQRTEGAHVPSGEAAQIAVNGNKFLLQQLTFRPPQLKVAEKLRGANKCFCHLRGADDKVSS